MGRKVDFRASYQADSAFLARLSVAIEMDKRQTADWKREMASHLNSARALLMEADARRLKSEAEG